MRNLELNLLGACIFGAQILKVKDKVVPVLN